MQPTSITIKFLADEVLTFIEQREAEQIAYGIYDLTLTGNEVIQNFQPSDDIQLPLGERESAIIQALQQLASDLQIIRFDQEEFPKDWVFRSRIAETVRLLTKLRQRIVNENPRKAAHRISKSKRLIEDVKFSVASRRVPRRDIPARTCMNPLLAGSSEQQQAANLLLTIIEQTLTKLQKMSGFQRRALRAILQAVELDPQQGIERGVVVTASTGAGKTYAFFLPVLAKIVLERCLRQQVGVKAICIYPRVALSENQLTDFIEVLYHLNQVLADHHLPAITIGVESGAAVYQIQDFQKVDSSQRERLAKQRGWNFNEEHQGYLSPFAYCVGTPEAACSKTRQRLLARPSQPEILVCPECAETYPFIKFARNLMEQAPPDLLIATTESLHRRLISSKYQYLFGTTTFCAPSVVMLDEIHLQTSTAGTQVALLLRRLLARIRIGKRDRAEQANLAFVGLSATIAQPKQFLSELSGIDPVRIEEVKPQDNEMQIIGAERFIFARAEDTEDTAVLSSLIQTAMCVLHTMQQPTPEQVENGLRRYRTFGFVQSLDIVGRWLYQMQDAEKVKKYQVEKRQELRKANILPTDDTYPIKYVPLYVYRYPPFNRLLFPKFFGPNTQYNCNCNKSCKPDLNCPLFQAGECWWVLSQQDRARSEPIIIKRKSGSDRSIVIEDNDDLVITTSALEVGYDDEALMCVIQYTAPANVASFVQRKGRGGRKVGTRPIVVTVLSPYKPTDLFLFRNEHLLTDPTFHKLPLNSQNRYLQQIHGFYALFDWLTYQAHLAGVELDLEELSRQGYQYLLNQTGSVNMMLRFKDYLQESFAIIDNDTLLRVLGDPDSDGFLWSIFCQGLMTAVHPKFDRENELTVEARKLLTQHLPDNLFSDVNLPEVRVDYRPDDNHLNKRLDPESISLAISETIPGNVTFRGGQGSTWIPPVVLEEQPLLPLSQYYTSKDQIENSPSTVNLPQRALKLVGITPRSGKFITIYRPTQIEPKLFSKDYNSSFWYCNPDTGELRECRFEDAPQDMYPLAHSCSAQPIAATYVDPIRNIPTDRYTLKPTDQSIFCDSVGKNLIQEIVLYSDEPDNLNLLDVRRIILGSQYTLKFHNPQVDEIRQVVGFTADENNLSNCALGYQLLTEGISIDLKSDAISDSILSSSTSTNLRSNAVRHAFITQLTVEYGESYFAAENLVNILLTITDNWCYQQAGTTEGLRTWFVAGSSEFNRQVTPTINQIHRLSRKKTDAVWQLIGSSNNYLSVFLDLYEEIQIGGNLYQNYLRDSFQYSLTQALKQVAQEVAGVEALNYVSAWTELRVDFGNRASNRIWLYEIGMGGIGVMRATQDLLRKNPDRFWTTLAHRMTRCPTAQEEAFLRHLLSQPEDWLAHCEELVDALIQARSSSARQAAIEVLLAEVRQQMQIIVQQKQLKALLRIFIPDYAQQVDGHRLVNWRIFREINQGFLPACTQRFGRDPSFAEARAILYRTVADSLHQPEQPLSYPELARLLQLYKTEYNSNEGEFRQAFESAVERRMLITCRCSCPSCLDDRGGDIEAPGLSRNLLNRSLLSDWLSQARNHQTLTLTEGATGSTVPPSISEQIRLLLEKGYQAVYLRVQSDRLPSLCEAISYLTDAGIDTDLGMVYPMITDIQTIYATDLTADQSPVIEVTVRPIE